MLFKMPMLFGFLISIVIAGSTDLPAQQTGKSETAQSDSVDNEQVKKESPDKELAHLIDEYDTAKEQWLVEKKAAKTKKEKAAARANNPSKVVGKKFLDLAKTCADTNAYVPALTQALGSNDSAEKLESAQLLVAVLTENKNESQSQQAAKAVDSQNMRKFLELLSYGLPSAERETLLKDLCQVGEGAVKGQALVALASVYKRRGTMQSWALRTSGGDSPEEKKRFKAYWGSGVTPEQFTKLEDMLSAYIAGDASKDSGSKRILEQAQDALFSLRHLMVGKPAPEIVGKDLSGVEFKLSDYRGKVVLLDFWAHW